jgi:hypothetical protein
MTKQAAIKLLDNKLKAGFITHKSLLDLFKADEDIPADYLDLCWHRFTPPKPYTVYMSLGAKKIFEESLNNL